ncbi:PPE domain-containing protein [Kibdelosporangium philippinense]|uniref:PPE domain-containing protein n=1 Tax=Kibdelosporangium philippinense TaxID=211113 RepID=A0ABS8Z3M2_9PSEU|nr:PPE domain-containing protein [Kibdelosporangium philippinense]MCE7002420.1 PPE domain-containing protein [Kibdelosporangium philippinense]
MDELSADDLIAKPAEQTGFEGTGGVESVANLVKDIGNDSNWQELTIDGAMVGLDALSMVMNPLGELVKAGVGWLMEHLDFIREPLEVLTGDPGQINAIAETWQNIGKRLVDATNEYQTAMTLTQGWQGDAATKYRALAQSYIDSLGHIAKQAEDAASGVKIAGVVVATTRAIIFDMIATFISNVITRALLALASSWFTFGASVGAFIASVIADAVQLAAKLQKRVGKLLQAIQQFVAKYRVLGDKSADAAKSLGRTSTEMGRAANKAIKDTTKTLDALAPNAGKLKAYTDYVERMGNSPIGKRLDGMGTKTVKEGTKAVNETVNPDED